MTGAKRDREAEDKKLEERMRSIKHKVLVLSGKGGVGKSTIAVNLAVALASAGKRVGLVDVDLHGPSVPGMLGIADMPLHGSEHSIKPFAIGDNLLVMSIGLLLKSGDEAVIWRGPLKMGVIKQFLADVEWGELDYLIVDSPPGTGDEPLSVAQLIPEADGAVVVTTSQDVAVMDVRKCITFCRQLHLPVLGVVENMSGYICPHCGEESELFGMGGGEKMAADMGVPFIGRIPFDPGMVAAGDSGQPFVIGHPESKAAKDLTMLAGPILALKDIEKSQSSGAGAAPTAGLKEDGKMKVGIPLDGGLVSEHFGHAEKFVIYEVTPKSGEINEIGLLDPPEHGVGVIPKWLSEEGVTLVLAGGIGQKAKDIFAEFGVEVISGVQIREPMEAVRAHLESGLVSDGKGCNQGSHEGCGSDGCGKGEC